MTDTANRQAPELTVDSHHHFWDLGKLDYGWMPPGPSVLRRNYSPEDMAPLLVQNGIDKTVVVQAHESVAEAEFLLGLAEAHDFIAGVVAWVDLTSPDVGKVLDRLGRRPGLVGIRHGVEHDADEAWLGRDDTIRGLKELPQRGLAYDLLLKLQHIKYVRLLAEKVPDLRLVVDHIAKPPIASGQMEPWAAEIADIATIPGLYCKLSGMVTEADHSRWSVDDLKPYVAHVVEQFGYGRLMWGSDWPVCLLAGPYGRVLEATLRAVGPITLEGRARLMGRNAIEFYRI